MQTRFVADEGDRMAGTHCDTVFSDDIAGIGIQSAWNVEREYRAVERIGIFNRNAQISSDWSRETNAE